MNRIKFIALALLCVCATPAWAQKDYKASMFGIRSDGITNNTRSIQKAIDYISENGGGRLMFYVGRYRTGTVYLKSNVTIQLEEGAGLMASTSPYDYEHVNGTAALIIAQGRQNIGITGKGLIDGEGIVVRQNIDQQTAKGNLPKGEESFRPAIIYFDNSTNIKLDGIILNNSGGDVQAFVKCTDVTINNITIASHPSPQTKGIVLDGCSGVTLTNSFVDTPSTPLALKGAGSKNITVKNSVTASGKKIAAGK